MREATCPSCGGCFGAPHGVKGAPEEGQRELYCSEECRDRAEASERAQGARLSRWRAPDPFPWDEGDPFAE